MYKKTNIIYTTLDSFFGVVSSLAILVVWCPQIWTTYKGKTAGSLSILMLCLTSPGGYLTIYLQAIVYHNRYWVWAPIVMSASLQTILLFMCIYYEYGSDIKGKFYKREPKITYHPVNLDRPTNDYNSRENSTDVLM